MTDAQTVLADFIATLRNCDQALRAVEVATLIPAEPASDALLDQLLQVRELCRSLPLTECRFDDEQLRRRWQGELLALDATIREMQSAGCYSERSPTVVWDAIIPLCQRAVFLVGGHTSVHRAYRDRLETDQAGQRLLDMLQGTPFPVDEHGRAFIAIPHDAFLVVTEHVWAGLTLRQSVCYRTSALCDIDQIRSLTRDAYLAQQVETAKREQEQAAAEQERRREQQSQLASFKAMLQQLRPDEIRELVGTAT